MILCDDWHYDIANDRRLTIVGLVSNVQPAEDLGYPLLLDEMCVLLLLTAGRGDGTARIKIVLEETGEPTFETRPRTISFGADPLEVIGVSFRLRNLIFERPGMYQAQFWYDGVMVEERPLRLR